MPELAGKRMPRAPEVVLQEVDQLLHFLRAGRVLDAGVDVLGVLAEDHHVDVARVRHRRHDAREVAHRPHAGVQVEVLAHRDVERADAAADRRRERALDRDDELLQRVLRLFRKPAARAVDLERALAGVHLHPLDPALARRRPCATAASTTASIAGVTSTPMPSPTMYGMIGRSRHVDRAIGVDGDRLAGGGHLDLLVEHRSVSSKLRLRRRQQNGPEGYPSGPLFCRNRRPRASPLPADGRGTESLSGARHPWRTALLRSSRASPWSRNGAPGSRW